MKTHTYSYFFALTLVTVITLWTPAAAAAYPIPPTSQESSDLFALFYLVTSTVHTCLEQKVIANKLLPYMEEIGLGFVLDKTFQKFMRPFTCTNSHNSFASHIQIFREMNQFERGCCLCIALSTLLQEDNVSSEAKIKVLLLVNKQLTALLFAGKALQSKCKSRLHPIPVEHASPPLSLCARCKTPITNQNKSCSVCGLIGEWACTKCGCNNSELDESCIGCEAKKDITMAS